MSAVWSYRPLGAPGMGSQEGPSVSHLWVPRSVSVVTVVTHTGEDQG